MGVCPHCFALLDESGVHVNGRPNGMFHSCGSHTWPPLLQFPEYEKEPLFVSNPMPKPIYNCNSVKQRWKDLWDDLRSPMPCPAF